MAAASPSAGVQHELGGRGGLVGVVDAGEAGELAGPRLLVEALGVALLAQLERGVDEHLDEGQARLGVHGPHPVAVRPGRG